MPTKKTKRPAQKGISLAFLKFIRRHEGELRSFHFNQVITAYGVRWLQEHASDISGRITSHTGDDCSPFRNIDLPVSAIIALAPQQQHFATHGTVVRLVTVFENFLYDSIQRTVFLDPSCIETFEIKVDAQALAGAITGGTPRAWFAHFVADKLCRSKSPHDLVTRVDKILQAGTSGGLKNELEEYVKWTLVRNAIAHLGGDVTNELAQKWPARFPSAGRSLALTDKDVLRVAYLTRVLAKSLDAGQRAVAGRQEDSKLLAAELFVRHGLADPSALSFEVNKTLSIRMNRTQAEKLLSTVRKEQLIETGVIVADEMMGR